MTPRPASLWNRSFATYSYLFHVQALASGPPAMYLDVGGHSLLIRGALFENRDRCERFSVRLHRISSSLLCMNKVEWSIHSPAQ